MAGASLAFAAHTSFVYRERQRAPTGRLLQFSPGSQDELVADTLKTGDLVLFSRDCVLYPCLEAAACAARQEYGPSKFDHAGVIVSLRGVPHVLEATAAGPRCRRYDARIKASRAREVVVRPLGLVLSERQRAALDAFLAGQGGVPGGLAGPAVGYSDPTPHLPALLSPAAGARHMADLVRMGLLDRGTNRSAEFVGEFYAALGLAPEGGGAGPGLSQRSAAPAPRHPPQRGLNMAQLADLYGQPIAGERFKQPVWVRDMR